MKIKFGENYWKCEIFDKQKRKIISIFNSRQNVTIYKIVLTPESLDIYVDNISKGKESEMLNELINIVDIFRSVTCSGELKDSNLEKVTLSKGFNITDEDYEKKFCGKTVNITKNNVGISFRYFNRAESPLIIYSYLINSADINIFLKDPAKYIDILADAIV